MADWTDGSEYAPLERPAGFASPRVAPLAVVEDAAHPADGQPASAPRGYSTTTGQPSLASVVPAPPAQRDPATPFDVGSDLVETGWGAVHASSTPWQPTEPLGSGDPAPAASATATTDSWAPPGQWAPPSETAPVVPTSTGTAPTAITFVVAGLLSLALLVPSLATVLYFVASLVPFTPVAWRGPVRSVFSLGFLGILIAWLWGSAGLGDFDIAAIAQLASALVLMTIGGMYLWSRRGRA